MFTEKDLVFRYTRADALNDGSLVDVSDMAKKAGFKFPVAVTQQVMADIENGISKNKTDVNGRLWDVLYMLHLKIKLSKSDSQWLLYELIMPVEGDKNTTYRLKAHIGPGDNGEAVITIMLPNED